MAECQIQIFFWKILTGLQLNFVKSELLVSKERTTPILTDVMRQVHGIKNDNLIYHRAQWSGK